MKNLLSCLGSHKELMHVLRLSLQIVGKVAMIVGGVLLMAALLVLLALVSGIH